MELGYRAQELEEVDFNQADFSPKVIEWVEKENLWNLWVPKEYGGLGLSLSGGLELQQSLARLDGSLGWTVTLCSGANFFIGNLQPELAREIFIDSNSPVCFGGSGGVFGTAEKLGEFYKISGTWRYATGAPYLSHFTLNAKILDNGKEVLASDGTPMIRSFLLPKSEVEIITDWNTMGLKATATHSFKVQDKLINKQNSFLYNQTFLSHPIFKLPFGIFTDLTLWVNYIGMAEHFLKAASFVVQPSVLEDLEKLLSKANKSVQRFSEEVETNIKNQQNIKDTYAQSLHQVAADSVGQISQQIIQVYPKLGMNASREGNLLNNIFKDYFTATQHRNFTEKH